MNMMTRGLMAALTAALLTSPVLAQQSAPTPLLPAGAEAAKTEAETLMDRAQKAWDTVQKAPLKALLALAGDAGVVNTYFSSCGASSLPLLEMANTKPFYLNAAWDAMPDDDERRQPFVERNRHMEEDIEQGLLALGKKLLANPDNLKQLWTVAKPTVHALLKGMDDDVLACQREKWTAYASAGALAATKGLPKPTTTDPDTAFLLENVATKAADGGYLETADDYATAFFERRLADSADSVALYAQISAELRDTVNAVAVERSKPQQ